MGFDHQNWKFKLKFLCLTPKKVQWNAEIPTSEIRKLPKLECLTVQISPTSDVWALKFPRNMSENETVSYRRFRPIARKLNILCPKTHLNRLVWALKAHTEWSVQNPNDFVLFVLKPIRLTVIQTFKNVRNLNKIVRISDVVWLPSHLKMGQKWIMWEPNLVGFWTLTVAV